jgi:hypothetical protein
MISMENVTINLLYKEILDLKREVKNLEEMLVPEEKLSDAGRKELEKDLKEALSAKSKNFREIRG